MYPARPNSASPMSGFVHVSVIPIISGCVSSAIHMHLCFACTSHNFVIKIFKYFLLLLLLEVLLESNYTFYSSNILEKVVLLLLE